MNPWLILAAVIGLIVLAGVLNGVRMWRKYTKVVGKRLEYYASLAKTCPIEQVPLVFQEVVELIEQVALTGRQKAEIQCIMAYLMGRNDQGNLPHMDQIVLI
jgi:hypothetical protein